MHQRKNWRHFMNWARLSASQLIISWATKYSYLYCIFFKNLLFRAANNGRSTDNVWSKLGTDRTNPWIARHLVRSFTDSFKEILIFNCLIITRDNSHVSERKKKKYKSRQISGREIPGSRKFPRCHQGVRTKHGPGVHGPPLWTGSMDHFHGPGPWIFIRRFCTRSMDTQKQK